MHGHAVQTPLVAERDEGRNQHSLVGNILARWNHLHPLPPSCSSLLDLALKVLRLRQRCQIIVWENAWE